MGGKVCPYRDPAFAVVEAFAVAAEVEVGDGKFKEYAGKCVAVVVDLRGDPCQLHGGCNLVGGEVTCAVLTAGEGRRWGRRQDVQGD